MPISSRQLDPKFLILPMGLAGIGVANRDYLPISLPLTLKTNFSDMSPLYVSTNKRRWWQLVLGRRFQIAQLLSSFFHLPIHLLQQNITEHSSLKYPDMFSHSCMLAGKIYISYDVKLFMTKHKIVRFPWLYSAITCLHLFPQNHSHPTLH